MKFNLDDTAETERAFSYLTELVGRHGIVDIKKVSPVRSLNQNAFLHVLIGAFAANFGWSLQEGKTKYKRVNSDLYAYEKNGEQFLKSSANLTVEEMSRSIERFREFSAEQGYPLPSAEDAGWLMQIENEIERAGRYL